MSVRAKVALELGLIAIFTAAFLTLFPRRSPFLDMILAGFALVALGLSAGYTKTVVWAATPSPIPEPRLKRCLKVVAWITFLPAFVFLLIGACIAYGNGGWLAALSRVLNWRMGAAFCFYLPWALVQQTLLQFYLFGRLMVLFPHRYRFVPMMITGLCFGLVHLPDVGSALITIVAGTVWSLIYYRYRLLLPLAFSHATLGAAFYYGIFGHDLSTEWSALLP